MNTLVSKSKLSTPSSSSRSSGSSCSSSESNESYNILELQVQHINYEPPPPTCQSFSHRSLAILSGHVGSVSCLALCGEFILSASQGKDIIVWQQPDLRLFAKFGQGDGSVKALATVGNKVFTAHQDSRIRCWKVSRSSENVFRLVDTLPTTKDYLGRFMKHSSWDKTLKVWSVSDLKCLESIKAHDDAINGLVACKGIIYSASADGKIKAWGKDSKNLHSLKGILKGHNDVSFNSVVVSDDGKWVYGGGSDGYVMCYEKINENVENWKMVFETKAHEMAVLCMCLMSDYLCTGSADKSIGIWKRESFGKICKVGVIIGHEGPVKCLQGSLSNRIGDGFLLYSGSLDRSVRVWWVSKYGKTQVEEKKLQHLVAH
ncbi:myosin heavy chain kinase B-like protein [Trifolium pratense]|uniref:Myosin heavy chain kinase B-like protein n=1 Tax=Trifolium pratense TaxID=57577 RepID=A0A2K3LJA7_TRIPR|nr:myosin heavy chain kinase B-like protein [Trifolium pratense]